MKKFLLVIIIAATLAACQGQALEWCAAWETLWGKTPVLVPVPRPEPAPQMEYVAPAAPAVKLGEGVFRVTGYGVAPQNTASPEQARLMAIGAARLDAERQLALLLKGADVQASSDSTEYALNNYRVSETTRSFLKGMRVMETRYGEGGIAEMDVEVVLAGSSRPVDFASLDGYKIRALSETVWPVSASIFQLPETEPDGNTIGTVTVEKQVEPPSPRGDNGAYTDLVIDARGLGLVVSSHPRAVLPNGAQIFPFTGGVLERYAPAKDPEVRFVNSMEEAQELKGFGQWPLTVKASKVHGRAKQELELPLDVLLKLKPLKESRLMRGDGYIVVLVDGKTGSDVH